MNYTDIANNAIAEIKRIKGTALLYKAPRYLSINKDGSIETSNLWLNQEDLAVGVAILPFSYRVISARDVSEFILFIDEKGRCNDNIEINGWNIRFDTPYERLYRTYNRVAIISKGAHKIRLQTPIGTVTTHDFQRIWKYFKIITTINDDFTSLHLINDLYSNDITINELKKENVRKEYEKYVAETLLNAHKELLNNISQKIQPFK